MLKLLSNFLNYFRNNKKKVILILLSFIIGIILFVSVFSYVDYKKLSKIIYQFKWWKFLIFVGVSTFSFLLTTYRWSLVIKTQGFKVRFFHLLQYRLAGFGFSYLTPVAEIGGAPFRAYLLKRDGIPFDKGLLNVIIDNFLEVFTQAILVSLGMLVFIYRFGFSKKIEWTIIFVIMAFLALLAFVLQRLRKGRLIVAPLFRKIRMKKTHRKFSKIERPFIDFFSGNKTVFVKTILITIVNFLAGILETGTLIYLMGFHIGWLNVVFAKILLNVSTLFPVPAGLGVSEWIQAGFFTQTTAGSSAGLMFSILTKAKSLLFAFIGILIFFYWWHKKTRWDKYFINFIKQKVNGKKFA